MELFNAPPRDTLSVAQKAGRALLVVVTLVTICIISALVLALLFFMMQRGHEVLAGIPQLEYVLSILAISIVVNVVCVMMLFQIKKLDRKLIPNPDVMIEIPLPPRGGTAQKSKA